MTKNEKIAISLGAVGGFVVFCLAIVWVAIPLSYALGYMFADSLRVTTVSYGDLAYAMGDEFVFVDDDIFDDDIILEDLPQIEYYGRSRSFTRNTPIKGARNYAFTICKDFDYYYHYQIRITCEKSNDENVDYEYSYGNSTYRVYGYDVDNLDKDYVGNLTCITFVSNTKLDNTPTNSLNVNFSFAPNFKSSSPRLFSAQDQLNCQSLFEYILDNVEGFKQFID